MRTIDLNKLIRPHLQGIVPYSSARDDFQGEGQIFLDANENPCNTGFNRYPDPHQRKIKKRLAEIKGVSSKNIFLGNGSDEGIDLLMRGFCEPGQDNIIILPPTYGMYKVSARINNIRVIQVPLDERFNLDVPKISQAITPQTKLIFLCSPNNPTGNNLSRAKINKLLEMFDGLLIVDEAYIDFSNELSLTTWLKDYSNLVVLQTLSKAWGLASVRVGLCLAHENIINLLDKIKPPYNISGPNQQQALQALAHPEQVLEIVRAIKSQRQYLVDELSKLNIIKKVYPSDANFLLVKTVNAHALYGYLAKHGIVVRNRTHEPGCEDCLRITVGTDTENQSLIEKLKQYE